MRHLFVFALTSLVSGCVAVSYVEPTTGDVARVRFVTTSKDVAVLRAYEGEDCAGKEQEWMRLRDGRLIGNDKRRLGLPLWTYSENAAQEVRVSSGKPLNAMFFGSGAAGNMVTACAVPFTVSFQKDRDYEILFSDEALWQQGMCSVDVAQIVTDKNGNAHKQSLGHYVNQVTPGCKAQFTRVR